MLGNKEAMAKNIKRNMRLKGVDRNRMSKDLKVSYTTLSDWINAKTYPRIDKIEMMANYFNITKADLVEEDSKPVINMDVIKIPVVASVSAGLPLYEETDIVDTTYITDTIYKEGKDFFGLKVSGNSMDKEFKDGDIVIVEKDAPIEDGQIGVVQVNGYESTLKRVRYNDDTIILMPESNDPSHQPQFYDKDDEVYLIGRVVGLNRSY